MRSYKNQLLVILSVCVLPLAAIAQPATGFPPFGTFHHTEFDSINAGNLNVHFEIPIVDKSGRGLGYNFHLAYDSSIWSPVWVSNGVQNYQVWQPTGGTYGGWGYQTVGTSGYVSYVTTMTLCNYQAQQYVTQRGNYVYHDPHGTAHSFSGSSAIVKADCPGIPYPMGFAATTTPDGSGYTLAVDSTNNLTPTVTSVSGEIIYPVQNEVWISDADGSTVDSNGNYTGGYRDTTGNTAISIHSNPPDRSYLYPSPTNPANLVGVTLHYTTYRVMGSFGWDSHCAVRAYTDPGNGVPLISSIVLADGSSYQFTYEPTPGQTGYVTARIASIRLPSGGTISYSYFGGSSGLGIYCTDGSASGIVRTTPDGVWTYTRAATESNGAISANTTTTIADPMGNQSVMNFVGGYETKRQVYSGTTTLLQTTETCYNGASFPCTTTTVGLPISRRTVRREIPDTSGLVSQTDTLYNSFSLVTDVNEYDFGQGAPPANPVRTTHTDYATLGNGIKDRPSAVTVKDGVGNIISQTTYAYDETTPTSTTGTPQHISVSGSRGNPTTITRLVQGTTTVKSIKSYYDTGNAASESDPFSGTDPAGHVTTYSYGTASCGNSFDTQITDALSHSTNVVWDCNGAVKTSITDPNNQTTTFVYGDPNFWRLTQTNFPDGGQATTTYNLGMVTPWNMTQATKITSSQTLTKKSVYDGLGRVIQTQLTSDPQGTVFTDTTYDGVGRVHTVSNPYRSGTDATTTTGLTTYAYDGMGRKISETEPDGSVLRTAYCGPNTLVTDPTGKWRRSRIDGLELLVEVDEPNAVGATVAATGCPGNSEPIWVTSYTNDVLGNLTNVLQNGSHPRTFTYDSLSRLLTSNNPESGLITYTYNPDDTVATKKDARTITATYSYDKVRRPTGITYSNNDPSLTFTYDQAACLGLSSCQNIGHRTSMTDGAGSEAWAYQIDPANLRSIHKERRTTNSSPSNITKSTKYYLDLSGNVTQLVYPTGRVVNYTYDSADRPSTAVDSANGITYATGWKTPPTNTSCVPSAVCYTPQGSVYGMSIGQTASFTGLNFSETYNNRLQPSALTASSTAGNAIDLTYNFVDPVSTQNSGNVYTITNNLNSSRSQAFTYDQVNRIVSAGTTATTGTYCWGYQYGYDAWSNLLAQAGWTPTYNACTETIMGAVTADGNNHISGVSYDARQYSQ